MPCWPPCTRDKKGPQAVQVVWEEGGQEMDSLGRNGPYLSYLLSMSAKYFQIQRSNVSTQIR